MTKPALEDMTDLERAVYLPTRPKLERIALEALAENKALHARLELLENRLREAETAIRPFADLGNWHESHNGDNPVVMEMHILGTGIRHPFGRLRLSHFRAALAWVNRGSGHE